MGWRRVKEKEENGEEGGKGTVEWKGREGEIEQEEEKEEENEIKRKKTKAKRKRRRE